MNQTQVRETRAAIRELKNARIRTAEYIKIPILVLYADTEFSARIASKIVVDEDGSAKVPNPEWTEINGRLSLLQKRMSEHDRIKEEREIARLQQKLEKAAQVEAAQEKRDKAAQEKSDKKAQEKRDKEEQRKLNEKARRNSFAALFV